MKFFLDTANVGQIEAAAAYGLVDGVTTNPSLIAKESGSQQEVLKAICDIVDGPVNGEVLSTDCDGMVNEAEALMKIADNIVIKIPMIPEGIKTVNILSKQGIATNVTLIFSPAQALVAAKAGANYISPFVGRLDDIGHVGMEIIETTAQMYDNFGMETEIITASVRSPLHVIDAALAGSHICTIPFSTIEKLFQHPLTDIGLEKFLADHRKAQQS
jgi:transaldolase